MPLPGCAELTPLAGGMELDELDDDEDEDDALLDALVDDCWFDEVDVPGIVDALTAAKTPRPANAPIAAPAVSRLSRRIASSRARILAWGGGEWSITGRKLESCCWTEPE